MVSEKIIKGTEISIQMSFNGTIDVFNLRDRLIQRCGVFGVNGKTKVCEEQFEDLKLSFSEMLNCEI